MSRPPTHAHRFLRPARLPAPREMGTQRPLKGTGTTVGPEATLTPAGIRRPPTGRRPAAVRTQAELRLAQVAPPQEVTRRPAERPTPAEPRQIIPVLQPPAAEPPTTATARSI